MDRSAAILERLEGVEAVDRPDAAELRRRLEAHDLWVRSRGREGKPLDAQGLDLTEFDLRGANLKKANLRGVQAGGADLRGAKLYRADLRGANLAGAKLQDADLVRADLSEADLSQADLQGADLGRAELAGTLLRRAVLRDANLADADLSEARGLLPAQLGGTNLAGARLGSDILKFEGLANVTEASKTTQGIFTSMILVCAYAWLTIASTTDAQLLNNAAPPSSRMPILGIDIPLVRFYMVAPLLLVSLYIYFHLGLQRLWEELADLPAIFPDGRPLDRKAYPWLMNGLVCAHTPRLRVNRSYLSRWQTRMSVLLAWGMVPLTIFLLWARYLRGHDWIVTGLHVALLGASIGAGVAFLRLASSTLRGSERRRFLWQKAWGDARARWLAASVGAVIILASISYGVIHGVYVPVVWKEEVGQQLVHQYFRPDPRRWAPALLDALGYSPTARLDDAALSTKPANWTPQQQDIQAVKGADLESRNLRYASAYNAFLINAYLHWSNLSWGDFRESDMRGADLRDVTAVGTNFRDANLAGADLRKADLRQARFYATRLDKVRMKGADLRQATLTKCELRGADLSGADLRQSDLREAKLQPVAEPESLDPRPTQLRDASLQGADLSRADLSEADLSGADLRCVNLTGAVLKRTDLRGADLRGAIGLTAEQLGLALVDGRTRLPEGFRIAGEPPTVVRR